MGRAGTLQVSDAPSERGGNFDALLHNDTKSRTKLANLAARTIGVARETAATAVPDQQMTEERPLLLRNEANQVLFDFFSGGFFGEPQAL